MDSFNLNGGNQEEMDRIKQEKKELKLEEKKRKSEAKRHKKEAKKKAKQIAAEEARLTEEESSTVPVIFTTLIIVLVWVGILCALIKLDVGGFGSNVLAPILKDVPVINAVLPEVEEPLLDENGEVIDVDVAGYDSLKDAILQIQELEQSIEEYQIEIAEKNERIEAMETEINRLSTFEDKQVEFERIKTEFYNEVIYAENGPGVEEYQKYYEAMDPAMAEVLYKQVIVQIQEDEEVRDYAQAYSEMKPKEAAGIFEAMTDNLELAARILGEMDADSRGQILGKMNPEIAAKITKIMEPDR